MFKRDLAAQIQEFKKFPAIAIQGPRQSGKTTLAKEYFKNYVYTSFEDPDTRDMAQNDPRKFLAVHENEHGIIIDEFQLVPHILSYIQLEVDEKDRPGYFVLTGSQNFLMNQASTQSLAGRVGILTLTTMSIHELVSNELIKKASSVDEVIFYGGYPRIYTKNLTPQKFYPSYVHSYVERDVRQLTNVGDLRSFQRFMRLCAGRVGQQLNLSELASVCGISVPTAQRWISILEASYVLFLLTPYFKNFNKRITKSPKIYFYDTGLVCEQLGIESSGQLITHPARAGIFENFIIADIIKQYLNLGLRPPVYFWRDLNGRMEVDCIIEQATHLTAIEIKSGQTFDSSFFDGLKKWNELTQTPADDNYVVYGGDLVQLRTPGHVCGWYAVNDLVKKLRSS